MYYLLFPNIGLFNVSFFMYKNLISSFIFIFIILLLVYMAAGEVLGIFILI